MAVALPTAEPAAAPAEDLAARNCRGGGPGTLCPSGFFQVRVKHLSRLIAVVEETVG